MGNQRRTYHTHTEGNKVRKGRSAIGSGAGNLQISRSSEKMAASAAVEEIDGLTVQTIEKAIQDQEEEYDEESQLFEEHEVLHKRLGKSLYYGGSESTSTDRLSL